MAARLAEIETDSGPTARNSVRASLSAFFAWAIREGMTDRNPAAFTNRATTAARERVLSEPELAVIWNALRDDDYGSVVRLLMLTGQRREEIGGLRWSEIDTEYAVIRLPAERTKNGRAHDVPFAAPAMAIIEAIPHRVGRDLLFGLGQGGFAGWHVSKQSLDQRARLNEPWVLHDLRRTAATGMADLGVAPHVIEVVLNHVSGHKAGVAGIYNRSAYEREKRAALELWTSRLMAIVEGKPGRIIPLRGA